MQESIYNLIPQERESPKKPVLHKSPKPTGKVPNSTFGCKGSTKLLGAGEMTLKEGALFGPPKAEFGLTSSLSLKSLNSSPSKESMSMSRSPSKFLSPGRRDPLPSQEDKPIFGLVSNKNFVTSNAVDVILQVPKQVGGSQLNYMEKEDFGKIPEYLASVKEEIKRENEMIERYIKERSGQMDQPHTVYEEMSDFEREELIEALKKKWSMVNAAYQKTTHLVILDTIGKERRKADFERTLAQLEKDIEKLSRGKTLYVSP